MGWIKNGPKKNRADFSSVRVRFISLTMIHEKWGQGPCWSSPRLPPSRDRAAEGIARSPMRAGENVLPTRTHPLRRQGSPRIRPTTSKMERRAWRQSPRRYPRRPAGRAPFRSSRARRGPVCTRASVHCRGGAQSPVASPLCPLCKQASKMDVDVWAPVLGGRGRRATPMRNPCGQVE